MRAIRRQTGTGVGDGGPRGRTEAGAMKKETP